MFSELSTLLLGQSIIIGIILLIFGVLLARRGLFSWMTTGFWAWAAFLLYFFANPLASIWWDIDRYRIRLFVSGGLERGEWISFVVIVGIIVFFVAYLLSSTQTLTWKLASESFHLTPPMILIMLAFSAIGLKSLLTFRTSVFSTNRTLVLESGRFVGETTGYEYKGHVFLFIPVALLLLAPSRLHRLMGWLLGSVYVVLSLPDAWSRFTMVSMLLLMSIADAVRRKKVWPRPMFIMVTIVLAAVLQLRGHQSLESTSEFMDLTREIPDQVGHIVASPDTAMLASFYLRSYISDTLVGYDYGVPLVNYIFFGAIPNRIFPQKYFLVDWLRSSRPQLSDELLLDLLRGSKSTLIGSFYENGGLLAIIIQAALAGILSRKMDGMLNEESPILVKATAVAWMSMLWIVWGSHDYWGVIRFGTMLMPAFAIWLVSPKLLSRKANLKAVGQKNIVNQATTFDSQVKVGQ